MRAAANRPPDLEIGNANPLWRRPSPVGLSPDDPNTISVLVTWRRAQPNALWIDINGRPLCEVKDWETRIGAELDRASFVLRELNSYGRA